MSKSLDYYEILQVKFGAQKADIAASYRRLCKIYHPDINRNAGTEEIMKQINSAYAYLSDDTRRDAYNRKYAPSRGGEQNASPGSASPGNASPGSASPGAASQEDTRAAKRSTSHASPASAADKSATDRPAAHASTRSSTPRASSTQRSPRTAYVSESERRAKEQKEEDTKKAFLVMQEYFSCLLIHNFQRAYELISDTDKQYITYRSFCDWRGVINSQYNMRDFTIKGSESVSGPALREGLNAPVKKHYINSLHRNLLNQAIEDQYSAKYTVLENGNWHILLGFRDLSEIAKIYEKLSLDQEKSEMEKHWEQYCADNCRQLAMLSLSGLMKKAESELYRYKRYKQALTIACFIIKPTAVEFSDKIMLNILETASKSIADSTREIDIPAYIGNGMFTVLFIELKKRQAQNIIKRLLDRLKKSVFIELGTSIEVESAILPYSGGDLKSYIDRFYEKFTK